MDGIYLLTGAPLADMPNNAFLDQLQRIRGALLALDSDDKRAEALVQLSSHPTWQVRYELLGAAREWSHLDTARKFVRDSTHDSVDVVAFRAIRYCGQIQDDRAIADLIRISGWPSQLMREDYLRKPVGIGAAMTKGALVQIFGTSDPDRLAEREKALLEHYRRQSSGTRKPHSLEDMVLVPGGDFIFGTDEPDARLFYYQDYVPEQVIGIPDFNIDKYPVTNFQYAQFLRDVGVNRHRFCHPDEPEDKDYRPAHWRDSRFAADDLPVTGVDWYDAWAYANWAGKKLPTERQWEKAARGTDGRRYPWGDDWVDSVCNWFGEAFELPASGLKEWEELLRDFSPDHPARPLLPVSSLPEGKSPYGVFGMAGNVWEWTRTNFFTHRDLDPFFKRRHPREFMNRPAAFPVIRGGCFTSLVEMLRCYYRGKDLLTDRHCEIGFRCVVEP